MIHTLTLLDMRQYQTCWVKSSMAKYPGIQVQLVGTDGNAFTIIGKIMREMRNHGVNEKEINKYKKDSMSGDYDNVLRTAIKWVDIV